MSEHVDALILIVHSSRIVADIPHYAHADLKQDLYYVDHSEHQWYNGGRMTESEKINIYTSEVLLKLGKLASSIYLNEPISFIKDENTSKSSTIDTFQNLSPLAKGEPLNLPFSLNRSSSKLAENGLPMIFDEALMQYPQLFAEVTSKWAIAQEIHARRGTLSLPGYNIDELIEGIGSLNMDEIAPTDVTGSSYDVDDLLHHAKVETHLFDSPYYGAFSIQTNAAQMLDSALEDLTLVSQAIK